MEQVVIVVPTQKINFSPPEKISLRQLYRVLNNYPIKFVIPQKNRDAFLVEYPGWEIECFYDEYFDSVADYSRMCLAPEFYERFAKYKFMLIYQTDAFVFSDRLLEFCGWNYDFIGAPMPRIWWPKLARHSFNGGLSLRKIDSFIYITKNISTILGKMDGSSSKLFIRSEDAFFSYCGESTKIDFTVPSFAMALKFSLQADTSHCYRKLSLTNLPFGCHGWSKRHYFPTWRPIIESFSGSLSHIASHILSMHSWDYKEQRRIWNDYYYLFPRLMRNENSYARKIMDKIIPLDAKYILWGNGFWGEDAIKCLKYLGLDILFIVDIKAKKGECREGIPIFKPDVLELDHLKYKIIITSYDYEFEIGTRLKDLGLIKDRDFFSYLTVKRRFLDEYYTRLYKSIMAKEF